MTNKFARVSPVAPTAVELKVRGLEASLDYLAAGVRIE